MTYFSVDEPFLVGVDFDGTITTNPYGGTDFPKPQKGFIDFYNWVEEYNKVESNKIILVLHTARNLDDDTNYQYITEYFKKYNLEKIYIPKRDGISMKNVLKEYKDFAIKFSYNSKIPCSCFIDDINIGTPKKRNGELNWKKIKKLVKKLLKNIAKFWQK